MFRQAREDAVDKQRNLNDCPPIPETQEILSLLRQELPTTQPEGPTSHSVNVLQKCWGNKPAEKQPKHARNYAADRPAVAFLRIEHTKPNASCNHNTKESRPADTHYRSPCPYPRRSEYVPLIALSQGFGWLEVLDYSIDGLGRSKRVAYGNRSQ